MKLRAVAPFLFTGLVAIAPMACVATASGDLVVDEEPPAPRVETVEVRPGYVHIEGHWYRRGGRWEWQEGRYERERTGHHWVAGHWDRRGKGHVWVEGRWEAHH
jgi:hypothetical protein